MHANFYKRRPLIDRILSLYTCYISLARDKLMRFKPDDTLLVTYNMSRVASLQISKLLNNLIFFVGSD